MHDGTGLPYGVTLLVAPTKDAAEVWSDRLRSSAGLSVLSYVMPLRERRKLSAKQAAAFDVVVTTYDVSVCVFGYVNGINTIYSAVMIADV